MADAQSIRGTLISSKSSSAFARNFLNLPIMDSLLDVTSLFFLFFFFPFITMFQDLHVTPLFIPRSVYIAHNINLTLMCFSGEDDVDETGGQMSNVGQQVDGSSDAEESQRLVS